MKDTRRGPAVAAVLLLLCLISACSGEGGTGAPASTPAVTAGPTAVTASPLVTTGPTAVTASPLPPKLPESRVHLQDFYSPSRNLACRVDDRDAGRSALAGCLVAQHDFANPPTPEDCAGDLVPAVWLGMDDTVTYGHCSGDPFAVPEKVLKYGTATVVGDFVCLSERTGVTCWNVTSRHGFVVSRESYRVF